MGEPTEGEILQRTKMLCSEDGYVWGEEEARANQRMATHVDHQQLNAYGISQPRERGADAGNAGISSSFDGSRALEQAGIEFLAENSGGAGVRIQKRADHVD